MEVRGPLWRCELTDDERRTLALALEITSRVGAGDVPDAEALYAEAERLGALDRLHEALVEPESRPLPEAA